jgi:hypothetical protein
VNVGMLRSITMSWEVHITVVGPRSAVGEAATRTGARVLSLALMDERGDDASCEEMLTLRIPAAMATAEHALATLQVKVVDAGLAIVRIKVEAAIDDNVPALYLEHHVKVRVEKTALHRLYL